MVVPLYILNDAFNGCTGLTSLTFNVGRMQICKGAFKDCNNIHDIYNYSYPTRFAYSKTSDGGLTFSTKGGNVTTQDVFSNSTSIDLYVKKEYKEEYEKLWTDFKSLIGKL